MARAEIFVRLLTIASILWSLLPPASVWAYPDHRPNYQTEEPTATPTVTETVQLPPTETSTLPATSEPTPTETATLPLPETSEPTPTETATETPPGTGEPPPTETATLPLETSEPSPTATETPPGTGEPTSTETAIPVETATLTSTVTLPPIETATPTPSATATLPVTLTATLTPTLTLTPTVTPELTSSLELSMSAAPASVTPGDLVTVTLALTNPGQLRIENLSISTTLPAELGYFNALGSLPASYNPLLQLLTWDVPADWAGQSNMTVGYVAQVAAGASPTGLSLAAEASVAPGGSSLASAQTSLVITPSIQPAATPFPVGPPATLQLGLEPGPGEPDQGQQRRWWLSVYVIDADGLAVADGTEVQLTIQGGSLAETTLQTRHGLATTRLVAQPGQVVSITAQAGQAQADWQVDPGATAELLPVEFDQDSDRYGRGRALALARNMLSQQGSDLVADNFTRRAAFNQDGLTFVLKGDRDTNKHVELNFELTGLSVGTPSQPLPLPGRGPEGVGNWALYQPDDAQWQLAYEVNDGAIEQYFLFEKGTPTDGDLVIEGRFQTPLQPELVSDEVGIRFRQPNGEGEAVLAFGPALVEDAQGRQLTAHLELQNRRLRIIIPAAWLAQAEFPVLVDPLIGPAELVSGLTSEVADPAAASDGSRFLNIWSWQGDIYGQLVDSSGVLSGSLITISQADGTQSKPDITYNPASDEYLVVWTDYRYGFTYTTLRGQRLKADGQLEGGEIEILPPAQNAGGPAVAAATGGAYLVTWSDQSASSMDVYGQMLTSSGVLSDTRLTLSDATGRQTTPDVAYDSGADLFQVVWSDQRDGSSYDIFGQQVTASGVISGANQQVAGDNDSQNLYEPVVAANPPPGAGGSSQFLIGWEQEISTSNHDIQARFLVNSSGWVTGTLLTIVNDSGQERYPAVTGTSGGEFLLLWRDDGEIKAQRLDSGGVQGSPMLLNEPVSGFRAFLAVGHGPSTGSGQSLGIWTDPTQAGQRTLTGRRVADGSGGLSGAEIFISPYYSRRERAALTQEPGSGSGFLLAWEQAAAAPKADIFVQPLNSQGLAGGNPLNLTNQAAAQERPDLAAGQNGYLVAWRDGRNEATSGLDLYGQLLTASGIPTGSLITISTAADTQSNPAVAYNSSRDDYLVVWDDYRDGGEPDIYGQVISSSGTPGAVFSITVAGRQAFPDVAYNPDQDQYLAVWEDDRTGTPGHDIYGQVISGDGSLIGSSFVVATATSDQFDAVVAYDSGSQSYLVTWWDRRSGVNYDIYGQIITGTSSLSGSNFAISTAGSNQEYPAIAVRPGASPGEFLVLWQDQRSSWNRDIYGQRVSAAGALLDETDTVADETNPAVNLPFDTGTDYTERPAVTYNSQAAVYLAAWNNRGDGGVYARRYSPTAPPTPGVGFSTAPLSGTVPLTVTFTDTSTGTIASRSWDFGDGTPFVITTSVVLSHTYLATGTFTATLTITNPSGTVLTSTLITVTEQTTPGLNVDFEGMDLGVDPTFWVDQLWDTTARDDFETMWAGGSGPDRALGTTYADNVVYSHYAIPGWASWQNYEYRGRLKMSDPAGGIGLALLSRYPAGEQKVYALRRYGGTAETESFHLVAFGTTLQGDTRLELTPQVNTWYRFRAQTVTHADRTTIRVKVWPEGGLEPTLWQAEASDSSTGRLTAGAVGVRTQGPGAKYFDDLVVTPLVLQADFTTPVRSGFAPFSPGFTATPLGQVLTYTWRFGDGSLPVSTSNLSVTHTYTEVGAYDVSLTVEGPAGSDILTRPAYIAATDLTTGLRGYWALEEASGQRLDSSGYGNHLTETNSVASVAGRVNQAADLEASDSEYLSITHTLQNGLAITSSLTLAGWVNLESLNQAMIVAGKYEFGINNRAYRLDIRDDNKPAFIVSPDGTTGDNFNLVGTTTLTSNTWSHLAAVFDAEGQTLALYLDGTVIGTRSVTYNTIYPSTAPFMLGTNMSSGSPTQFFDGQLDEWRVYGRALSGSEIQGLLAATPPTVDFSATPLTGTIPLVVSFSNATTGPATYLWDFGDGLTSTLTHPSHVYTQAGVYTVTLTATGPGGSANAVRPDYISAYAQTTGLTTTIDSNGGSLLAPSGVEIEFPAGAVTETVVITYTDLVTDIGQVITPFIAFSLEAATLSASEPVTTFGQLLTITVPYSETYLGDNPEEFVYLFYEDSPGGSWHPILESWTVTETNRLVSLVDHFTDFAGMSLSGPTVPEGLRLPATSNFGTSEFYGSATVDIPIELPPLPGGFALPLSLNYSSDAINSIRSTTESNGRHYDHADHHTQAGRYGLGWSLSGLPSISRGPMGKIAPIPWLSLDDYRPMYADVFGGSITTWQTHPVSFIKIQNGPAAVCQNWADWACLNKYIWNSVPWQIWNQDGTKYVFGDAQRFDNGCRSQYATSYLLTEKIDTHGNRAEITYGKELGSASCGDKDGGYDRAAYPTLIKFFPANEPAPTVQVRLISSAGRLDAGAVGDDPYYSNSYVTNIIVEVYEAGSWQTYRQYDFSYDYVDSPEVNEPGKGHFRHLLLRTVTPTVRSGAAFPAYTFKYTSDETPVTTSDWNYTRLVEANNGYGGRVRYIYAPLDSVSCGDDRRIGRYRVEEIATYDGMSSSPVARSTFAYDPGYCRIDSGSSWFFGYPKVTKSNWQEQTQLNQTQTFFYAHDTYGGAGFMAHKLMGHPYQTVTTAGGHTQTSNTTWETIRVINIPPVNQLNLGIDWVRKTLETETLDNRTKQTEYIYNTAGWPYNYGHPIEILAKGDPNISTDDQRTVISYIHNPTLSILGRQQTVQIYNGVGALLRESRFYYDQSPGGTLNLPPTRGDLTAKVEVNQGYTPSEMKTGYEYDTYGNQTKVIDARNNETISEYDSHYHAYLTKKINALAQATSFTYDYALGVMTAEIGPNGLNTAINYSYDNLGRLTKVIRPGDNSSNPTQQYSYQFPTLDGNGQISTPFRVIAEQRDDSGSSASYMTSRYFYNGLGQLIQTQGESDQAGQMLVLNQAYNAQGQVSQQSHPYEVTDNGGAYLTPLWPHPVTYSYDGLSRLLVTSYPDGRSSSIQYSGWDQTLINEKSQKRDHQYDAFGRLVKVIEYNGSNPYATTTYVYNAMGELVKVQDAAGNETVLTYDRLGRKIAMADPDMGNWTYEYDAAGNLVEQTDARSVPVITTLTYDELNRLTSKSYSNGEPAITYGYDGGTYGIGQRTVMTDAAGSVTWSYDERGRLVSEARHFGGAYEVLDNSFNLPSGNYVISYAYDRADRVITTTYPDGEAIATTYTARGLPQSMNSYVTSAVYDEQARLTELNLENDLQTLYSYWAPNAPNKGNQLYTLQVKPIGGSALMDLRYEDYDPVGNIKEIIDQSINQTLTFNYDHLDRLTSASASSGSIPGYNESYTYNTIGNMTARNGQSYAYPPSGPGSSRPHAVTAVGSNTYSYDNNGNMTTRVEDNITYTQSWNAENKLKKVTWSEDNQVYTNTFVYDGDGNRLLKIEKLPGSLPGQTQVEITTVYIGQIYEEQFDTTASNLQAWIGIGSGEQFALARPNHSPAGQLNLSRPGGLAAPLPLLSPAAPAASTPVVATQAVEPAGLLLTGGPQLISSTAALSEAVPAVGGPALAEIQAAPDIISSTVSLPEGVTPEWWAAAQETIRKGEYEITWQEQTSLPDLPAAYQAPNRAHNLRTYFTPTGIRVIPREAAEPAWSWGLALAEYGYEGKLKPVDEADLVVEGSRAEYRRGPLTEWYINDERGLEQGFTLANRPGQSRGQPLVLELAISGDLILTLVGESEIEFANQAGEVLLRYGGLHVYDATGRELSARLELNGSKIRLLVVDRDAVYPITIDPLLSSATWTAESNQTDAHLGFSVAGAGDINNDGFDDIIVGAPGYDGGQSSEGKVFVWYGSSGGLGTSGANWSAESNLAGAELGSSVAGAGHINNDGFDDIIVAARSYNGGQAAEGKVFVWYGSSGGLGTSGANWSAEDNQALASFGDSVASAGDINNDGFDDIIVGAPLYDGGQGNEGKVFVWYGSSGGLGTSGANWSAESNLASTELGSSVAGAGDINNDGFDDIIVGAPLYDGGQGNEGKVFVWYGSSGGLGTSGANWSVESNLASAYFGDSVASAGDINNDGFDDIIVGAPLYNGGQAAEGKVFVWYGGSGGLGTSGANWSAESNLASAYFGDSVAGAGDINNDGFDDIIVGAPSYDGGQVAEGKVFVWYGSSGGLGTSGANWSVEGNLAGAELGFSVASAGDINNDGNDDIIVSAPFYSTGGKVFVYLSDNTPPQNPTRPATETHGVQDTQWTKIANPSFSWSGADDELSGVTGYHVYFGSNPNGTNSTLITLPQYTPAVLTTTGIYTLRVQTGDGAGNWSAWVPLFEYRYDGTAPTNPTSTTFTPGGTPNGQWQNITGKPSFTWSGASDPHSGVWGYEIYWDTDPSGITPTTPLISPEYTSPITVPSGSTYYLRGRTRDVVGNWAAWTTLFTFKYDNVPPTITNVSPANGALVTNPQPVISGSLADPAPGSGIVPTQTLMILDGITVTLQSSLATGFAYTPTQALAPGQHYVTVRAYDLAGNKTETSWSFTVDPDTWVDITVPAQNITVNQPTLPLEIELEPTAGMLLVLAVGTQVSTYTVNTGSWITDSLTLQTGPNLITATVWDPAGNTAVDTVTVTVDPEAHVALAHADPAVFNPNNDSTAFFLTALPGTGWQVEEWELTVKDENNQLITSVQGVTPMDHEPIPWDGRDQAHQIVADGVYTYQLVLTATNDTQTETATSAPRQVTVTTQPPAVPTLVCNPNPTWFSIAPGLAKGTAANNVYIQIYIDGSIKAVAPVYNGQWQAALPLADDQLKVIEVSAIDLAGNESTLTAPCNMGLSQTEPFTIPHASLSDTYIGLGNSVTITATTRTSGAPAQWVTANVPTEANPIDLAETPLASGTWTGAWLVPTSGTLEGVVVVDLDTEDNATPIPNHGDQFVQPYLDLVPPWVTVTRPPYGSFVGDTSVSIKGQSEILSTLIVTATRRSDGQVVTGTGFSNALGHWQVDLTLGEGVHDVVAQAIDRGDNIGPVSAPVMFTVDTTGPVISNVSSNPAFVQPNYSVRVTATITDALSQVKWAQVMADDLPQSPQSTTQSLIFKGNNEYTRLIPTTSASEGRKELTLTAWDIVDNITTLPDGGFIVDGTPPVMTPLTLTLVSPVGLYLTGTTFYYSPVASGQLSVGFYASDTAIGHETSGLKDLIFPDVFEGGDGQTIILDGLLQASHTQLYPVLSSQEVASEFEVRAVDRALNVSQRTFRVEKDATGPSLTGLSLSATGGDANEVYANSSIQTFYYSQNATGNMRVEITASDSQSGLAAVIYPDIFTTGDGATLPQTGQHGPQTFQRQYPILASQNINSAFNLTVKDKVDNQTTSPAFRVVRDTVAPTVAVTVPTRAPIRFTVAWAGSDPAVSPGQPGASVRNYDVQVRDASTPTWTPWLTDTTSTEAQFTGSPGHSYYFQGRATDNVNNTGAWQQAGPVAINAVTKYYTFGSSRVAMRQGDEVYYLHGDHLGSTSLTTDGSGAVVAQSRYLPYGQERWSDGAAPTDFGFTGQRNEAGFGLMDYQARYYDPQIGRWLSPDTIVPDYTNPQSLNRYSYVLNNPLKHIDPSGHQECENQDDCNQSTPPLHDDNSDDQSSIFDVEDIDHPQGKIWFGIPKRPPVNQEVADALGGVALVLDTISYAISAVAAGSAYIGAVKAGGPVAYEIVNLGYQASAGNVENALGGLSLLATAGADVAAGNTYVSDEGLVVGQDTYVSLTLTAVGFIPDVTTDGLSNMAGVIYDVNSFMGHPGATSQLPGNMFISKYWVAPRVPPKPQ